MAILKSPEEQYGVVANMKREPLPPGYKPLKEGRIYINNGKVLYESKAVDGQTFDFHLFSVDEQIVSEPTYKDRHDHFVANLIKNQIKPTKPWSEDIAEAIKIIKDDWGRLEPYLVIDTKDKQQQPKTNVKTDIIQDVVIGSRKIPLVIVRDGLVMPVMITENKAEFLSEEDVSDIGRTFPSVEPLNAQYSKGPSQITHIDFVAGRK